MINIGVVGAGLYGRVHLDAFKQRERERGDARAAAFADLSETARRAGERDFGIKGYPSLEEMLEHEDLDGVTVVTPDHLHHRLVMACLAAGKHVFVEKPLSTDLAEAEEMAGEAERRNLLLQVDFHKRFDPYHVDLKLRIRGGELGNLQYGYCWMEDVLRVGTDMIGQPHWGGRGSPAWFLGTHMIDLSCWLMDFPEPVRAYATGGRGKLKSLGRDIYDSIKATVSYANGVAVTYDTAVILPDSHEAVLRQGVKMVGTEGFLVVDSQYRGSRGCTTGEGMRTPNCGGFGRKFAKNGEAIKAGYINDSLVDFAENLAELKRGAAPADLAGRYASAREGVVSTRIGVAIHQSLETGALVDIRKL
ncbi:MAG: Gfo/Idh/MocA family oxidoreductase [Planctomycetota bacterium]|jgi:predicted dehydrogenase|nr:Gfo/Idh/MocA family oxidoreductase [Planctomycetota bacterium]